MALEFWVDTVKGESPIRTWDKLQLGPIVFPGLATVEPETGTQIEVSKQNLNVNADQNTTAPKIEPRLFDRGYDPGKIKAAIQVWTKDDWQTLQDQIKLIRPTVGKRIYNQKRDAWDIVHPAAALLGITTVLVTHISVPRIVNQTLTLQLDLLEWFPRGIYYTVHGGSGALNPNDFKVDSLQPGATLK